VLCKHPSGCLAMSNDYLRGVLQEVDELEAKAHGGGSAGCLRT
jgi:hypothetical protein